MPSGLLLETWNNPLRSIEVVSTSGAIEQHVMQPVDLADMDAWRNVQTILGCGLNFVGDESGGAGLPQEALSGFLEFKVDLEQTSANPDCVEQNRPKGEVLKFERPPHMSLKEISLDHFQWLYLKQLENSEDLSRYCF
jgi:hypothetical protein